MRSALACRYGVVRKSTQVPQIYKVRCGFVSTNHHGLGCLGVPSENDSVLKSTRANTGSARPWEDPADPVLRSLLPLPPPRVCVRACVSAWGPGSCDPHPGAPAAPRPAGPERAASGCAAPCGGVPGLASSRVRPAPAESETAAAGRKPP